MQLSAVGINLTTKAKNLKSEHFLANRRPQHTFKCLNNLCAKKNVALVAEKIKF